MTDNILKVVKRYNTDNDAKVQMDQLQKKVKSPVLCGKIVVKKFTV